MRASELGRKQKECLSSKQVERKEAWRGAKGANLSTGRNQDVAASTMPMMMMMMMMIATIIISGRLIVAKQNDGSDKRRRVAQPSRDGNEIEIFKPVWLVLLHTNAC